MTVQPTEGPRRLLPRWRTWAQTLVTGELAPSKAGLARNTTDQMETWHLRANSLEGRKAIHRAADLLAEGFTLGIDISIDPTARELAEAASHHAETPPGIACLLSIIGEPQLEEENAPNSAQIAFKRQHVRRFPNDSIAWVELSRAYLLARLHAKSRRAMTVACALAGQNRFVVRSAVRQLALAEDFDHAAELSAAAARATSDPWILAAALSSAGHAGRPSRFVREAKMLLESDSVNPFHTAELAAALGALERDAGHDRAARRFFRLALRAPTDNVVAHIESLDASDLLNERPTQVEVPFTFEAQARHYSRTYDWTRAVASGQRWLDDQPFDADAATVTAYALSMGLEQYERAAAILDDSLTLNPTNSLIANNLAYCLAHLNRLDEAAHLVVRAIQGSDSTLHKAVYRATTGLILFRAGDAARGRALYKEAIEQLRREGQRQRASLASLLLAREEIRMTDAYSLDLARAAIDQTAGESDVEVAQWRTRVTAELERALSRDGGRSE